MSAALPLIARALAAYLLWPVAGLMIGWAIWRLAGRGATSGASVGRLLGVGSVAFAWLVVVLAAANALHPWVVAAICGILVIAACVALRLERAPPGFERPRLDPKAWPAILLLFAAGWLLARPAETFLVTDDAAVYTLGAVHLAETGSLYYDDPGVLPLDPRRPDLPMPSHTTAYWDYLQDYARQFLLPENVGVPAGTRFWGPFFQPVLYQQEIEIGFLPLTKAVGAIFGWALGIEHVVWAGPALALLSLAALIGIARRAGGWGLAAPAATMLALSLPQVWFGRQLLSEPVAQALVLGALWLDGQGQSVTDGRAKRLLWGAEAAALGLLPLVRLEGLLLALVLLVWLTWNGRSTEGGHRRLWAYAGGALALGQALAILTSPAYFYSRIIGMLSGQRRAVLIGGLLLLAAMVVVGRWLQHGASARRLWRWLRCRRAGQALSGAIGLAYVLVVAVHILLGPVISPFIGWLAQYWTRPALLLGALGMALAPWVLAEERRALRSLLTSGACFGLLFAAAPLVTWAHPWVMRRAVLVLLPALAVGATLAVGELFALALRRIKSSATMRMAAQAGFALVMSGLCWGVAQRTLPIMWHSERQGMWSQIAQVDALLAPESVLLLDDGQIGRQLGQALALVYGHAVYNVQQTEALSADSEMVQRLIAAARAQGREVYWLVSDSSRRFEPQSVDLASVGGVHFDTPTVSATAAGPPGAQHLIRQAFLVDVYAILPHPESAALSTVVDIPLGIGSYPYLHSGFYGLEQDPTLGAFRWTEADARIQAPWPEEEADAPAAFDLVVELSGWRPTGGADPLVTVSVEGETLLAATLPGDGSLVTLRASAVDLCNTGDARLEVQLSSDVFVPSEYGLGADTRQLGVKLYGLSIAPSNEAD